MRSQFLLLFFSALVIPSLTSFCGSSGVPFSFEVLPSGAPVLGCAQPSCVASPEEKDDSNFLVNADGQTDGFMRDGDKENRRYGDPYANKLIANCSGKFADLTCPRNDQWVGGIEYIDHPRQPLILQCCTFAGLRFSQEVGVTNVGPGEAITGGEVIRDGRQISFDVIANARKVVDANTHVVSYEVTVRRMNCLPDPPEPVVDFEKGVTDEVVKVLTKATDRATFQKEKTLKKEKLENVPGDRAFGATIQKVDERKQRKKTVSESYNTSISDGSQPVQTEQQRQAKPASAETFSTTDATFTGSRPAAHLGSGSNLEVGSGGITGGFSSGLGFGGGQIPPELQRQSQTFVQQQQQQQGGSFGNQAPQPPLYAGTGLNQPIAGAQGFQPGPEQFYRPCAPECNRVPCPTQRCNEGRDPIFGFPILAPPAFPTFPTLPTHTFPTFPTPAPHTFATLIPHTYPTIAPPPPPPASGYLSPSGSSGVPAFGAPTHVAASAVGEIPGDGSSGGGLATLSFPTSAPVAATSSSIGGGVIPGEAPIFSGGQAHGAGTAFTPLPSFEEFMARLGLYNMTFATLAPATFGAPTTAAPATPVPLPAAGPGAVPERHPQLFIQNVGVAPSSSQARHDQPPGSAVFYASQQWSSSSPDFANNDLPRAAAFQQS